jgi:FolB domain-containing protein
LDQVLIKDLMCRGKIGITEQERAQPQDILVNVVLFTDITHASQTDAIDDCVNYRTVAKNIQAFVEKSGRKTVEALSSDIASICLKENGVQMVRVRVEKPRAVRFAESVGVEIERSNPNPAK